MLSENGVLSASLRTGTLRAILNIVSKRVQHEVDKKSFEWFSGRTIDSLQFFID